MDWGTLGAMAAILFGVVGLQSFWIASRLDSIRTRFDRVDASLDRIENTMLVTLDRRVTRLEERL